MHKIFRSFIVFMCIFALTHHLPTISASASDLSSSTISSSSATLPSSSTGASRAVNERVDIATAKSSGASTKPTDLFAIEKDVAAKEISIAATSWPLSASSASSSSSSFLLPSSSQPLEYQEKLTVRRRQIRSLFYSYPYDNLFSAWCAYYNPYFSYSHAFYPTFHKFWRAFNPYPHYGYPRVVYG